MDYGNNFMKQYTSWGLYPKSKPKCIEKIYWANDIDFSKIPFTVLPFGKGRSYGDVCLNNEGCLLDTTNLNHFIHLDIENSTLKCESGVTLDQILNLIVPQGFFLPVTPGTKHITIGGAIANDVHGKNHHNCGSFGNFVTKFALLKSDGKIYICSKHENSELFRATIGGLGLTGLILWAEIKLKRIPSEFLQLEVIKFKSFEEFFELNSLSEKKFEYTVAWVDLTNGGLNNIRGIFQRANHIGMFPKSQKTSKSFSFPFRLPFSLINDFTIFCFNVLYYSKQFEKRKEHFIHYEPFFYPLDFIKNWNFFYGKKGFVQYQFVIPSENSLQNLKQLTNKIKSFGLNSFLTVLKSFGNFPSAGLLSFPKPGITLAIDFSFSNNLLKKLDYLDKMIIDFGGRIYPAKDSRMKPEIFRASFPELNNFIMFKDNKFNSSFWKRVTAT